MPLKPTRITSRRKLRYIQALNYSFPAEHIDKLKDFISEIETSKTVCSLSDRCVDVLYHSIVIKLSRLSDEADEAMANNDGKACAKKSLEATSWEFAASAIKEEREIRKYKRKIINERSMCKL